MALFEIVPLLLLALVISFIISEAFFRFRIPREVGMIVAGVLLGFPILKILFSTDAISVIEALAEPKHFAW